MRLNLTTDYAIRTVMYLAVRREIVRAAEISDVLKIPQEYIGAMARRLRKVGILRSEYGTNGGYGLNRAPGDITLYEIVNAMESTTLLRCMEEDRSCFCGTIENCTVRKNLVNIQRTFDSMLREITVESLL